MQNIKLGIITIIKKLQNLGGAKAYNSSWQDCSIINQLEKDEIVKILI